MCIGLLSTSQILIFQLIYDLGVNHKRAVVIEHIVQRGEPVSSMILPLRWLATRRGQSA